MASATTSGIKRLFRNGLALLVAEALAIFCNQPHLIWLAPVINAVAKTLRDKNKTVSIF